MIVDIHLEYSISLKQFHGLAQLADRPVFSFFLTTKKYGGFRSQLGYKQKQLDGYGQSFSDDIWGCHHWGHQVAAPLANPQAPSPWGPRVLGQEKTWREFTSVDMIWQSFEMLLSLYMLFNLLHDLSWFDMIWQGIFTWLKWYNCGLSDRHGDSNNQFTPDNLWLFNITTATRHLW